MSDDEYPYVTKACGTPDLLTIYAEARRRGFPRQMADSTAIGVDPNGVHVLTLIYTVREEPPFVIVSALLKMMDTNRLHAVKLDVSTPQWDLLPTLDEAQVEVDSDSGIMARLIDGIERTEVTS